MDTLVGTRDQKWIWRCDLASLVRDYSKIMQVRPTAALAPRPGALSAPYDSSRAFPTSNKLSQSLARVLRGVLGWSSSRVCTERRSRSGHPHRDASGGPSRSCSQPPSQLGRETSYSLLVSFLTHPSANSILGYFIPASRFSDAFIQ